MKLQSVSIDRFGQLEHFRVESLSDGLTVLHGTNGSGKTTLLNFIRFVLYGDHPGRHESFLDDQTYRGRLTFRESGAPLVIERTASQGRSSLAAMCSTTSPADDVTTRRAEVLLEQLSNDFRADAYARLFAVGQREVHEIDDLLADVDRAGLLQTEASNGSLAKQAAELREQVGLDGNSSNDATGQRPAQPPAQGSRIWRLFENLQRLERAVRAAEQDSRERFDELNRQHAVQLNELNNAKRDVAELTESLASLDRDIDRTRTSIDEVTAALERELADVRARVHSSFEELQQLDAESLRVQAVIRDLEIHKSTLAGEIRRLEDEARLHTGNDLTTAALRDTVTRLEQRLAGVQQSLDSTESRDADSQCPNCDEGSRSLADVRRELFQLCAGVSRIEAQERIDALQTRLQRIECAHGDLQLHRDALVSARARVIASIGRIPQIELFVRTQRIGDFCRCEQHQNYWDEFRAASASNTKFGVFGDSAAVTVGDLTSPELDHAKQQLATLQRRQGELQDRLATAQARAEQTQGSLTVGDESDCEDRTLRLQLERDVTKRQLQDAVKDWCASHVAADIIEVFDQEREARRDPTVLEQASAYLNRLTEGHYRRIELDDERQLVVHPSTGSARRLDNFSRGTRDQIALSLRLVLAEEFARRGVNWPLILDDVFVDSDANRARVAVQLLAECAERGCQIVYLTCHEYLCQLFQEIGIEARRFEDCRVRGVRELRPELGRDTPTDLDDAGDALPSEVTTASQLSVVGQDESDSGNQASTAPLKFAQFRQADRAPQPMAVDLVVARPLTWSTPQADATAKPETKPSPEQSRSTSQQQTVRRTSKSVDEPATDQSATGEPASDGLGSPSYGSRSHGPPSRSTDSTREPQLLNLTTTSHSSYSNTASSSEEHGAMPDHGRVRVEVHEQTDGELADESEFFLHPWSLTRQIPGLGQQAIRGLRALKIEVVGDLVQADSNALRQQLGRLDIPVERFNCWQRQAQLMCRMPGLDGLSARLLAECGYSHPDEILAADSRELLEFIRAHLRTIHGRWFAACRQTVDGSSVSRWRRGARRARPFARTPSSRRERRRQSNNQQRSRQSRSRGRLSMRQLRIDAGHTLRGPRGRRRTQSRTPEQDQVQISDSETNHGQTDRTVEQETDQPSLHIWRADKRRSANEPSSQAGTNERQALSNRRERQSRERAESREAGSRNRSNAERSRPERKPQEATADQSGQGVRFYLTRQSDVEDAPTIGPKMAERLAAIEIITVDDLLRSRAAQVAKELRHRRVKENDVAEWQLQSELMCTVPGLRGHDAQVLVACGVKTADQLASMDPSTLWGTVEPFVSSKKGKRLLRSANRPDLAEVTDWIEWARSRHKYAESQLRKAG